MKKRDTKRRVNFLTETYVEDRERVQHLGTLLKKGITGVCWCIHDYDRANDGSLKKPHCHAVIHLENAMSLSAFCTNFVIRDRFVQTCTKGDELEDLDAALLYMVHADKKSRSEGKSPYPLDSIKGPMAEYAHQRITALLSRKKSRSSADDEGKDFLDILTYVESSLHLSMTELSRWCAENGHWASFRRSSGIVRDILREHNDYLDRLAERSEFEDYKDRLAAEHSKEAVFQELGIRALRGLNTLLHQTGKPSVQLCEQIESSELELSRIVSASRGVDMALLKSI